VLIPGRRRGRVGAVSTFEAISLLMARFS